MLYKNCSISEMGFNEFEPRFKSAKTRFKLSAGLNLETLDTILSGTTIFKPRLKFKPPLKFFKFGIFGISCVETMDKNSKIS